MSQRRVIFWPEGKATDQLKKLAKLSEKILALGESINRVEKDMESTWVDQIEMRDLRNVKRRLKEMEDALCMMQEEIGRPETEHSKKV